MRARRVKAPKGPRSLCARCTGDCTDVEHALTREQGAALAGVTLAANEVCS